MTTMHSLEIATGTLSPLGQGVTDIATRTLVQVRQLMDSWRFAPRDLYELRDSILGFRELLETALQAGEHFVTKTPGHGASFQGLYHELASAKNTLSQLEGLLVDIQGHNDAIEPYVLLQASMRTQWLFHREEAIKLLVKINDSHQRILARLASLNLVVSTVESSPEGGLMGFDSLEDQLEIRKTRDKFRYMQGVVPANEHNQKFRHMQEVMDEQTQTRDVHNEQKFRHLEAVFKTVTTTLTSQDPATAQLVPAYPRWSEMPRRGRVGTPRQGHSTVVTAQDLSSPTAVRPPDTRMGRMPTGNCKTSCRCRCHLSRSVSVANWGLYGFKSTLGSFSFIFTGRLNSQIPCNVNSCRGRQASKHYHATYTFPSWLLHATISAVFTDVNGGPELVLRVLRRDRGEYAGLFGYITRGEMDNVKRLLQRREGSVLDVFEHDGTSVLGHAYKWQRFNILELLLQEGADIFQADDAGEAPCHAAIQMIYTATNVPSSLRDSLSDNLPLDEMMEYCALTDLHKVVMGIRCLDVREYLYLGSSQAYINTGDVNGQTPLFYASARGDVYAVQALLDAGALVDTVSSSKVGIAETPLHVACRHGHIEVVEKLIEAGADVHARAKSLTPLHKACFWAHSNKGQPTENIINIVAKLLDQGADIQATNKHGTAPLDYASATSPALVQYLIDAGADQTHRDWEGTNALGNAIAHNACDCAAILLRYEPACRNIDDNGYDLLHYLGLCASVEMMELFMDSAMPSGLDVTRQDNFGKTALDLCHGRVDATDRMKEAFARLLEKVATNYPTESDSDGDSDGDDSPSASDAGEFVDALENVI